MKENQELPKAYDPSLHEDRIYKKWEDSGKFNPDNLEVAKDAKSFTIMMPPPNATGVLHLGHASMLAYQDIMIRFARMNGKRTLWLPGTDHASIATQTRVEKNILEEEGKTRHDLGRVELLKRIDTFVEKSRSTIRSQVRKMGSSCDWSRERYTLDKGMSDSVQKIFISMYNDGLIYRGDRVVNWCPRCLSTIADDEVEYATKNAKFYTFKYSKDFPFAISTTRPETKLADTAVAVHPGDERYKEYIGKTFEVNFAGGVKLKIKVIGNHNVDKDFGTGALGVTPAHSMVDFAMAQENDLPMIKLINEKGLINENGGSFAGQSVLEARKGVVSWLNENDLMIEEKDISQNLSVCYRCNHAIEPLPSLQWFVNVDKDVKFPDGKVETLKSRALRVVKDDQITFTPERFKNVYLNWMENLHNWCISRQIWFGHRIPAWYKGNEVYVGLDKPEGEGWTEESDTLDTWFSSGQWTFAALGWPTNQKDGSGNDLEKFHPTDVLETGYDIIFFWVARMILMTEYAIAEVPFRNVYLHGLVKDASGKKMSKSLGNALDPLEVIPKFGTDALRLSLVVGSTPGNDIKISEEKIEGYRNFVNKLYNIARYILTSTEDVKTKGVPKTKTMADEWILSRLDRAVVETTKNIEQKNFSAGAESLRDFTWNEFADWYLEIAKIEGDKDEILRYVLKTTLKLWHPFTPFITEYLWEQLDESMLMIQSWPSVSAKVEDVPYNQIMELISSIRTVRGENKIDPVLKVKALVVSSNINFIKEQESVIKRLARLEKIEIVDSINVRPKFSAMSLTPTGDTIYLLLEGLLDLDKEKTRLTKEIESGKKTIAGLSGKLANESYVKGAPAEIVAESKEQLSNAQKLVEKLQEQLESFN